MRILLLFWAVIPTWAVTRVVPTNGDPYANGTQLQAVLNASDCGDTIVLQAGAEYRTPAAPFSTITLPFVNTAACNSDNPQYITITSTRIRELPADIRVSPDSVGSMATISADSTGSSAITVSAHAHHFRFEGILFTTTDHVNSSAGMVNYLIGDDKATVTIGTFPHHIWVDRCVLRPAEHAAQGTDPFRSAAQGVVIEGQEIRITNSYLYEFEGVRTDSPIRQVTTITNSSAPILTSATPHGHPVGDPLNAYIYGATGNWTRINGWNYAVPTDATHFSLKKAVQYLTVAGGTATASEYYHRPHNLQVGDRITISGVNYPGATGLNGVKTVTAVPSAYDFSWSQAGVPAGGYCAGGESCLFQDASSGYFAVWDASSAGTVTGSLTWRDAVPHNSYAVAVIAAPGPLRVINSYLSGWFSSIFLGGGGSPTQYSATLTNPTPGGATFSDTSGLRVGEIVALQTPYTGYLGGWRTVRVDGISGNSVTWSPWGLTRLSTVNDSYSSGICSTNGASVTTNKYVGFQNYYPGVPVIINGVPYTIANIASNSSFVLTSSAGNQNQVPCALAMTVPSGSLAQWRGVPGPSVEVRRNTFDLPSWGFPNSGICKAAHELKIVNGGVWDGNIYTGFPCVTLGLTQRNQTGSSPWSSLRDLRFTNNLVLNAERTAQMLIDDDLATTVRKSQVPSNFEYGGGGLRFENNLFLDSDTTSYYALAWIGMEVSDVWSHNTFLRTNVTGALNATTCDTSRIPPYGFLQGQFLNNIIKWGFYGFNSGSCWTQRDLVVRKNVIIDSANVGSSTINAAAPGNLYADSVSTVRFQGTCDAAGNDWLNCALAANSPFRGAATDGRDPGADVLQIQDHIRGWSEQASLETAPGSTRAVLSFSALESGAQTCSLRLYINGARTTLHADTSSVQAQSCARAGNVSDGSRVQFVLGTNSPLTPSTKYWYMIQDGSRTLVGDFSTAPAGTARTDTVQFGMPQEVVYSANADLSGGRTLPAAATQQIPVPAQGVVYWRAGVGPIRVRVNP